MYSRNDYRYYLEHRLEESDDFLAHHGVKGMRRGQPNNRKEAARIATSGRYDVTYAARIAAENAQKKRKKK